MNANPHDAYAADYDQQVEAYGSHVTDVLFGLCYELVEPSQRLLDAGIGTGLSAQLFARAGLAIYGMDFSPAMLALCCDKGLAVYLQQHDIRQQPWPYPVGAFDHLVCCGVLHFVADLQAIFAEARRVLAKGGLFAFSTRVPTTLTADRSGYEWHTTGGFEIFSHRPAYLEGLLARYCFAPCKSQKCFVGDDLFLAWVVAA